MALTKDHGRASYDVLTAPIGAPAVSRLRPPAPRREFFLLRMFRTARYNRQQRAQLDQAARESYAHPANTSPRPIR